MADIPSLDQADLSGMKEFYTDFTTLIRAGVGIDHAYGKGQLNADISVPKFRKVLALFNKKYKDICLTLKRNPSSMELQISFLGEQSLQTLFANSASHIKGLSALGLKGFDEVPITEQGKLEKTLSNMGKRVYVSYTDAESNSTSKFMIERHGRHFLLVCDRKHIFLRNLPEFILCAYYALRHPYNRKIDVNGPASAFGISESITLEHRDLLDEFEHVSRIY